MQSGDDDEDYEDDDLADDGDDIVPSSSSDESNESTDSEDKLPEKEVKRSQTSSSESETEVESSPEKQNVSSVKLDQLLTETMKKEEIQPSLEPKTPVISPGKKLSPPSASSLSDAKLWVPPRGLKVSKKEPLRKYSR